jgi:hypothetical protein
MQRPDFRIMIRALLEKDVDFLIVGGVAAVLQGAPVSTFDLDIVHSREASNLDRLSAALDDLAAYYREQSDRRIAPDAGSLAGPGHHLLLTSAGPLDILGITVTGDDYSSLLVHSENMELADGLAVRVLNLDKLIELKERLGSEKDLAVLPILRRALQEREKNRDR